MHERERERKAKVYDYLCSTYRLVHGLDLLDTLGFDEGIPFFGCAPEFERLSVEIGADVGVVFQW